MPRLFANSFRGKPLLAGLARGTTLAALALAAALGLPAPAQAAAEIFYDVLGTRADNPAAIDWSVYATIDASKLPAAKAEELVNKAVQRAFDDGAKRVKVRRTLIPDDFRKPSTTTDLGEASRGGRLAPGVFEVGPPPRPNPSDTAKGAKPARPSEDEELDRLRAARRSALTAIGRLEGRKGQSVKAQFDATNSLIDAYNRRLKDFISRYGRDYGMRELAPLTGDGGAEKAKAAGPYRVEMRMRTDRGWTQWLNTWNVASPYNNGRFNKDLYARKSYDSLEQARAALRQQDYHRRAEAPVIRSYPFELRITDPTGKVVR